MEEYKLFDAEYRLMDLLWQREPVNSTEFCRICQEKLGWKKPTTYTMLRKLAQRGLLKNEHATVSSCVKREQVQQYESEVLLEKSFSGSLPVFLATFLRGKTLTQQEAEELKRMIEEATK